MSQPESAPPPTRRRPRLLTVASRMPATLGLLAVLLLAGLVTGSLHSPFERSPLWDDLAYGVPAFEAGRWWTVVTGTFLMNAPWAYPLIIVSLWGMGYLEWRRGSRVALAYFGGGQLFSVLVTALLLWGFALTPWAWAQEEAALLDVGPSGGLFACMAAAIGLFAAPWRLRGWVVLLSYVTISVIFWGTIYAVEHLVAVLLVLVIDRSLRPQRATVREQRLLAFVATIGIGVMEIATQLVPTDGPFGLTDPVSGPWYGLALNIAIIVLVADGLRHGRLWAWVGSVLLSCLNLAIGFLVLGAGFTVGWGPIINTDGDVGLAIASAVMWLLMLIFLVWVRRAFRAKPRRPLGAATPSLDEVKDTIRRHGGGTLSWMTTWRGNEYLSTSGGGLVAYQRHRGVAIALADPLGPPEARSAAVHEFIDAAQHAGLVPCFFSASDATRAATPAGWRSLVVADDTIVDLPGLTFTGKSWSSVRTALNRAGREEMTFRLTTLKEESWGIQAQLRAISEVWVGDKGLPEMGFTLGSLDEAEDREVRLALAVSPYGDVDGFLSWLPVYGGDGAVVGWTLDLMRRREGGFPPVMEFLIGSSAKTFSDEGALFMSLSGAPLAHEYPPNAGMIAALSDKLGAMLEPVYGFASLHRFKEKFHPRYETMYLLYRDEGDLARIATGLTRAFLPDATLRQFAGAGLELVTGR
jgi:phosphatidylglycerol lysyltransferase